MNYLKITKYIYLAIGFIMLYDVYTRWQQKEDYVLSAILAGLAFFTFFFRSRFSKKFEDRRNNPNNPK